LNSSPNYVVDVHSVTLFKSRLDKFGADQKVVFDCNHRQIAV